MSQRQTRSMYYVEGSTVRKLNEKTYEQTSPAIRPERRTTPARRSIREERVSKKAAARYDKALAFDARYTLFVVASVFVMVCACVTLLFWEAKIESQESNISNLQSQLEDLQTDNAAYENELNNMYSLDDIYDAAVNELGMVYARKGQIVYYDNADEDYVNQYYDVPEAN